MHNSKVLVFFYISAISVSSILYFVNVFIFQIKVLNMNVFNGNVPGAFEL